MKDPRITARNENNFRAHPATPEQVAKMDTIREKHLELAELVNELCPASREQSESLTLLETSMFFANAAIMRNPEQV